MIDIENLSIKYDSLVAIENISMKIASHEIVSIVGASGCGKTTLIKAIGALLADKSSIDIQGKITISSLSPKEAKVKKMFGYVSQNPTLLPWRNVWQNISLPLELLGISERDIVENIINFIGLKEFSKAFPHELSGGMKQRVSLARTLVHNPAILLMDEPFGSLDEITRESINSSLLELQRERNQTMIFVTHSLREALFMSDRIIILTPRPSKIKTIFSVELPKLRDKYTYFEKNYVDQHRVLQDVFCN